MTDNKSRKQLFSYLQKKGVYDNEDTFNSDMDTEEGRRSLYDRMYQGGAAIKWEDFDRNLRPELAEAAENRTEQAEKTAEVKPTGEATVSGTENIPTPTAPKGKTSATGTSVTTTKKTAVSAGTTVPASSKPVSTPTEATKDTIASVSSESEPLIIKNADVKPDGGLNEFMEEAYWQSPQAVKLKKDTHEFFNTSLIGRADEFIKYGKSRAEKFKEEAFRSHNFESGYAGDLAEADAKAEWAKDPQKVIDNFNKILGIKPVDSSVKNGVLTKNERKYTVRNGYVVGTPEQEALQHFVLKQLGLPTNTFDDGAEGEKAVAPLSDEQQKEWMRMYNDEMNHVVTCIQEELRNYLIEREMPQSWYDYVLSGAFKDSTIGAIKSIIMDKAAKNSGFRLAMMEGMENMTVKDYVTSEAERRYLDKLGFCSRALLSGARGATSMIIDAPVFALGGAGSATAAAKVGNWVGMKFGNKLAANVAARVVSGGMTFGGYDLIQEGIGQIVSEELDWSTWESAMKSAGGMLGSYAKGFATGGVLGATNTAVDRVAQKMLDRGSRMAAYAVHGAGYAAEVGLFTGTEVAAESSLNGEFIGWDKTFEILGKQGVLIGLLKGKGKLEQVYDRVQTAKRINEALGLDSNNLQELKDAGYDDDKIRMMIAGQKVKPTDFKPNAEVKAPNDKSYFENVAEEERADLIKKMMADPSVSWDTKQKMMQALTGYIMPDVPAAGVAVNTDDKGKKQILVKDGSGNVISRKYVTDENLASELNKAHNRVRVSQVAQMEDALMNCATQLPSAIEKVAKDNHMSYDRIVACLRAEEQGNAEGWQHKIAEQVRNTSRTLAIQENIYEGAARIKSEVEEQTGVDLDIAMSHSNPSTAQMEAMDMYISRLNEKCEELSEHNDWVNEQAKATAEAQRQVEAVADRLRPYANEQGKIKTAVVDGKQVYIANETDDFYFVTDGNGDAPVGVSKDKASNVTELDFDGEMAAVTSQTVEEALGKLENRKMGLHEETPAKYTADQSIEMGGADGKPVNAVVTGVDANGLVTYQTTNEKGEVTDIGQTDADALKRMQSEFFKARDRAKEKSEREGIVYSPEWAMAEKRKEEDAMAKAQEDWAAKAVAFGKSLSTEVKVFHTLQEVIDEYGSESEQAQRCKERLNRRTGKVISPAKGWYDIDGTVGLFVPAGKSEKDMKQTILHEIVGHSGIPSLLIDGWEGMNNAERAKARTALFTELYDQLGDKQRTEVEEMANAKYGGDIVEATDEYLATTAEKDEIPSWFGKVAGAIRTGLRDKGYVAETDGDILYLLWRSRMAKIGEGDGFFGSVQDMAMRLKLGIDRMRGGKQESRAEEQAPTKEVEPTASSEPEVKEEAPSEEAVPSEGAIPTEPQAAEGNTTIPESSEPELAIAPSDAVSAGAVFATKTSNGTDVRVEIGATDTDGRVELKIFTEGNDTPYVEYRTTDEVQELVSMDGVSLIKPAPVKEAAPTEEVIPAEPQAATNDGTTVPGSSEPEPKPASAYDLIPTDENGRKDYTKATVDETWEALNERYGDDAKLMAEEALSMAETEAEKMKKSGDLDAYGDAFRKVKYWKGVNETVNRRIEAERQEAARKEAVDAIDNIINNGLNPDDAHVLTTFGLVEKTMREEIEHEQDPYKKQAMSDYWNSISEELMPAYNREYWNTALAMRTKGGKVSVKTVLDDLDPKVGEDMLLDLGVDLDYNLGMNASWAGFKQSNAYKIMTKENRTDIADVLDMVAAENKAKREEFRKKKEAEASRMREGEEEENKKANTNEGTGSMVAPVSERSAAVAPQTSSNTLNQSGKVLSSGLESFSLINSGAKVRFRDEDTKEIFSKNTTDSKNKVRKAINGDKISKREFHEPVELVREIAKNVGLLRAKSTASYYKTYGIGDEAVELRISHHPLHGKNIRKSDADRAVSLVIYKDGKHEGGQEIPFEEYIHYVPDGEYAKVGEDILKGVGEFLDTGNYPNYANGEKFTYSREEYEDSNTRYRSTDEEEDHMRDIRVYLATGENKLTNWEMEDEEFRLMTELVIENRLKDVAYDEFLEENNYEAEGERHLDEFLMSDKGKDFRRRISRIEQDLQDVRDAMTKKVSEDWAKVTARTPEEDDKLWDEVRGVDHKLVTRKIREGQKGRRKHYTGRIAFRYREGDEDDKKERPEDYFGLYSNAEKAVIDIKQTKAAPDQWINMLRNNGGLKEGEDKWMGLSDWLKTKKGAITKEEVIDFIRKNNIHINEVNYAELANVEDSMRLKELREEFRNLVAIAEEEIGSVYVHDHEDWAMEQMCEHYGEEFRDAFEVGEYSELIPTRDYYEDDTLSDAARYYLDVTEKEINPTRLRYTTEGLTNKREIALTVPSIEGWQYGDTIHFGDADEGTVVAWSRFGDAMEHKDVNYSPHVIGLVDKGKNASGRELYYFDIEGKGTGTLPKDYCVQATLRDTGETVYAIFANDNYISRHETKEQAIEAMNKWYEEHPRKKRVSNSVLVIDEVQSNRHQEGREHGYNKLPDTSGCIIETKENGERVVLVPNGVNESGETNYTSVPVGSKWMASDKEAKIYAVRHVMGDSGNRNKVPDAPFDKNWHELVMKRMVRYAAENGYDKVAWTTGNQQAERYNLGDVVDEIDVSPYEAQSGSEIDGFDIDIRLNDGSPISLFADKEGHITSGEYAGQTLADVVGKDIANQLLSTTVPTTIEGADLRLGGDGMRAFYDKMLVNYMNKFGKKFGAKVSVIDLPDLEESAQKMWSIDVTPEMKRTAMDEGFPMFREGDTENAPLTDKERKLRDHLIHTIRRAGIDIITDVEQGQRVLDMMNGTEDVKFMGSKVEKRKQRVAAELKGKNLSEQQAAVVNVFTGNADNLPLTVNRDGKDITIVMRQGNESGAGTKHSLYRHYDTTTGVITADDILRIPDVLANGERKPVMRGKTRLFEYSLKDADNTVFRVLTEMNNRFDETFADFYTNRKASSTARKTHSEEAQADIDNALSGAKVGNNSESAKLHKVFHGSGADFDAFDHSHMGEGEGAQAYGWGTYVTEVEGIGKTYAKSAARKPEGARPVQYKGEDFTQTNQEGWSQEKKDNFADIIEQMVSMGDNASEAIDHVFEDYERNLSQYKSLTAYDKEAIENLQNSINYLHGMTDEEFNERNKDGKWEVTNDIFERILVYDFHLGRNGMLAACENELERKREHLKLGEKFIERNKKRLETLDDFDEKDFTRVSYQPMLYTVDIPDDNGTNYLDYREPTDDTTMERIFGTLVKQGWKYREIVQVDKIPTYRFEKDDNFFYIERFEPVRNMLDILGDESSLGSDKAASKLFHDAGFVGIKYPAEYRSGGREDNAKNYVIFDENDAKIVDKVKFFRTDNGQAFGYTFGGKIYIDPRIATAETPIHEYGHLWTEALRNANPEAWNHLKEQMETRKDIIDVVRKMYPELKGDELLEEMFQHFAGKRGAERLRAEQARLEAEAPTADEKTIINRTFDTIRQMLSDFWQQIRNLLIGSNNKISDLTPEDFADMALSDLLGGENPTDPDRTTRFRDEEDSSKVKAPEREKGESIFDYAERMDKWHKEHAAIAQAEAQTDTNPTDGQKEAGNYRKGKFTIDSMTISVENPKGSTRSGVDANGKKWSVTMNNTYGYILGTEGVDGDHIDVFLSDDPTAGRVFVIDQVNDDGSFDEHKVMYGFDSEEEAKKAYLSNYSKGWKGLGNITEVSKEDFKKWISSSHRKTKPFAEYKMVKSAPLREDSTEKEEIERFNTSFNEQLGKFTIEDADKFNFKLGRPSSILKAAGVADKPILLYGNKLAKKLKKHGFDVKDISDLPRMTAHPIAVFNNYGNNDNRSVLTELKTSQGNILVALTVGKNNYADFNIVASAFGKSQEKIIDWLKNGKATYIDKEKALDYLYSSAPIAATPNNQELYDATKVVKDFDSDKFWNDYQASSQQNRTLDSSKNATLTSGVDKSETRFRWIGEEGAEREDRSEGSTDRMDGLKVAKRMAKRNKTDKSIKLATGWERGADGKWRYEEGSINFNDEAIQKLPTKEYVDNMPITDIIDDDELVAAYPMLKYVTFSNKPNDNGLLGFYRYSDRLLNVDMTELLGEKMHLAKLEKKLAEKKKIAARDFDEDFLRNSEEWEIDIEEEVKKAAEEDIPFLERVVANTKERLAFEYNKCKEVLNHEIQHFIQQQEKWAEGGSPRTVRNYLKNLQDITEEPYQQREWIETHSDIVGIKYNLDRAMTLFRNPKRFLRMGDHFKYSGSKEELIRTGQELAVDGYFRAADQLEIYADAYDLNLKDYGIDIEELNNKIQSLYKMGYSPADIAKRGIAAPQMKKFYADVERLSAKDAKGAHKAVNDYDKLQSDLTKLLDRELYSRLAGEVEARNASARMDFTKAERRNSLASETEDVQRGNQIVVNPTIGISYGTRFRDDEGSDTADEQIGDKIGGTWKVGKDGRFTWHEDNEEQVVRKNRRGKTIGARAQALLDEGTSSWQEQVKLMLAGTKMRGEDRESGTKGLISHTTGNRKDVANWCAKKGDADALTPEELAEKIQAELPEGIRENVSDQDVFNEIIDTVMSYNTHKALIDDLERVRFEQETEGMAEYEKEQADAYARERGFGSWDEYTSYEGYVEAEGERLRKAARDRYLRRLGYDGEEGYIREMSRLSRIQRAEARKRRQKEIKEELLAMVHQAEQRPIVPVRKKGESVFDYAERVGAYQEAQRKYDESHPVEAMNRDDAMRAVRDLVNEQLDRDSVSEMDKRTLNSILRTLSSTNVTNLEARLEEAKRLVQRIKVRANQNDIQKMLDLKVKDVNGKNMNVAKNVDDDTRRIMERLKGSVLDVQDSGLEDRIHDLRSENWRLRESLRSKDVEADTQDIIGRIDANNKQIESLNEERKRILAKKARSGEINVEKAINDLQAKMDKDAEVGNIDNNDVIDMTALTLQKLLLGSNAEDINVIELESKLAAVRRAKKMLYGKYESRLKEAKQAVDEEPSHDNLMKWQEVSKEYAEQRDRLINMENGLNRIINEAQANKMDIQEALYEQLKNVVDGGKDSLKTILANQQQRRLAIMHDCFEDITGTGERAKPSDIDNDSNKKEKWYKSAFTAALSSFEYMAQNIATRSLGKDGKFYRQFVSGKDGVISANNTYIVGMRNARERLDEKVAEIFKDWKPEARTRKRDKYGRFIWNGLRGDGKDLDKIETFADWWQVMDMQPVEGEWGKRHNVFVNGVPATTGVTVLDMTDLNNEGKPNGSRLEIKDMSKGQATYIYQLWKMNDGRGKLELMGFDDASMEQVADYIGAENMRMADWIQDEYLQEMREKYNSRYKEIYNTSMAAIENYVPIKINSGEVMEKIDLTGDTGNGAGKLVVKTGALINRTANDKSIDRSWSAAHVLWDHLDKMEEFYAFSPVRRDLSYVFGSQFFRNQLNKNSHGAFDRLVKAAEVAVHAERDNGGDDMDKVFATIQKGLVGGNIAFRNNTALKQMLSAPAFIGYSQDPEFLASLALNMGKIYLGNSKALATVMATFGAKGKDIFDNTAKGKGNFLTRLTDDVKWCLDNVPDFYERVLKGSAGDSRLDEKGMENVIGRFIDKYMEQGMRSNQMVDALTCAIGIKTIYDYKMKKADRRIARDLEKLPTSMTKEEIEDWKKKEREEEHRQAIMEATIYYNGTQQSNHKAFLSPLQVSRGFLQRAVSLYMNAAIGFARRFTNACIDLYRMRNWNKINEDYTRRLLEEKGYKKDDVVPDKVRKETEEEANKYLRNEMRKRVVEVGLYGFVLNFLWDMGGKGLLGLFRNKDEEEQDKDVWDNITYLATLPGRGTTGMNLITGVLSGQRPEIGLHVSEIGKFIDNYKKAQEEYGIISPEVAYVVMERAARFGGIDLNTWTNTYLGVERLVRDGYKLFDASDPTDKADMIVDLMLAIQSPESQRAAVAKRLYTEKYKAMYPTEEEFRAHLGECIEDYIKDVTRAMKYVQEGDTWESWLPSTKILKEQQENSLRKEFIERNLTEEERKQYEDFKEFKKEVKGLPDLASAQKLFRDTKEEGRREMIISKMRTLAKQDEGDKGVEDEIATMLGVKAADNEEWKKIYITEENDNDAFEDIRLNQKMKEMKAVNDELNKLAKKDEGAAEKYEKEHEEDLDRFWEFSDIVADLREKKLELGGIDLTDEDRKELWKSIRALRRRALQY